jgi:hypothetical protein
VGAVLTGTYRDLLPAIAECGATLTGLLFVAITVANRHNPAPPDLIKTNEPVALRPPHRTTSMKERSGSNNNAPSLMW